jgi:hypothetical protein
MNKPSTSKDIITQASTLGNSGRGYQGAYIGKRGYQEADSPFAIPRLLAEEADALPRVARDSVPAGAPSGRVKGRGSKATPLSASTDLSNLRSNSEFADNTRSWDRFWRRVFEGLEGDEGAPSGNLG